jgi:hypothetical protein
MIERQDAREKSASKYRRLAEEAETLASQTIFADLRESYRRYARQWRALADETEKLASIFKNHGFKN